MTYRDRLFPVALVCFLSFTAAAQTQTEAVQSRYWREEFFDDFRGKPDNSARSTYCYDELPPQCFLFTTNDTYPCDQSKSNGGAFPPLRENMAAAINSVDPGPWAQQPYEDVRKRYGHLIANNVRHLDKCTWTLFETLNIWARNGNDFTSRFDGSQVRVDTAGKGRLLLSAARAPVEADCVFGGVLSGQRCVVDEFSPNEIEPDVAYWVAGFGTDPKRDGMAVYYAPGPDGCPEGSTAGANCVLRMFPPAQLEERNDLYKIDTAVSPPILYYTNDTSYRCTNNLVFDPFVIRNLTCPLLNGAVMSAEFKNDPFKDPATGQESKRGLLQRRGRFEVKSRIPKGHGAFPAAWLLPQVLFSEDGRPEERGWPYPGGEIDVMEARDQADEVYQTYHHGNCFTENPLTVHSATGLFDCMKIAGATSAQVSYSKTFRQRLVDEFSLRDHVFAVEWVGDRLDFFVNNVHVGTVEPGTQATHLFSAKAGTGAEHHSPITPDLLPPSMSVFAASNFPTDAFYWILNHSAYGWDDFQPQTHAIDWVRNYTACTTDAELCRCGGTFQEGIGCILPAGAALACPDSVPTPALAGGVYQSDCRRVRHNCIHGGAAAGSNCQIRAFENPEVIKGVEYWVETNPRWPGVYYAPVDGRCPFGGAAGANCQIKAFPVPPVYVTPEVTYWVDATDKWPGVYYAPTDGKCEYGGSVGANCHILAFPPGTVAENVDYWVDTNPRWPGVYYKPVDGECPFGGSKGANCQVHAFATPEVVRDVTYWVDTNPRWPGVYYELIDGECPFGGTKGANCQLLAFKAPPTYVVPGVEYWVDSNPEWPGVYYPLTDGGCPYGGRAGVNCRLMAFAPDVLESGVTYWVETDPRWPGIYYAPDFR